MMDEFLKKRNLLRDSCSVSPREFKVFSLDGSHQPLPLELCMHMHSTEATMHTVCITSTILYYSKSSTKSNAGKSVRTRAPAFGFKF